MLHARAIVLMQLMTPNTHTRTLIPRILCPSSSQRVLYASLARMILIRCRLDLREALLFVRAALRRNQRSLICFAALHCLPRY